VRAMGSTACSPFDERGMMRATADSAAAVSMRGPDPRLRYDGKAAKALSVNAERVDLPVRRSG
jgi:hypothetical protein